MSAAFDARRCGACGATGSRVYLDVDGRCTGCVEAAREEAKRRSLDEQDRERERLAQERERALDASPHRCLDCREAHVLEDGSRCPECDAVHDDKRRRSNIASDTRSRVPVRFQWAAFNAPELHERVKDPSAPDRVRAAVRDNVDRMLLHGVAGVGKTVLGTCALLSASFRRGLDGLFVDAFALAHARQDARLGEEPYAITQAREAAILLLDDLGSEPAVASSPIPELLHDRHAAMGVTIVTSGFTLEQLEQRYGAGVFRRLTEDAEVIELRAPKGTPR